MEIMSNNWMTEKWQRVSILCTGKVVNEKWVGKMVNDKITIKLLRNGIRKMRTAAKGEQGRDNLLDKAKISINFSNVEIEHPCFVHFEFDDFRPWFIPMDKDSKQFINDFMVPPGKWKMFFTTQLSYFVLSTV